MWDIHFGSLILKVINNAFHTNLATRHSKKRCWLHSSRPHKLHSESPFHLLFNKLSFAKITPFFKYQKKKKFEGNFAFQNTFFPKIFSLFIISLYINWAEKTPFFLFCQLILSLSFFRLTCSTTTTKLGHSFSISPTITCLKETFNGIELSTLATKPPFSSLFYTSPRISALMIVD